jgi:hypothetical protein
MIKITKNDIPTNRNFGFIFSLFFLIIFLYLYILKSLFILTLFILSFIFLFLGILNSKILSPLNLFWMYFGKLLGSIIAPIIMLTIYILLVIPIGFLLRLFNKDILKIKIKKNLSSYWDDRKYQHDMKDQF